MKPVLPLILFLLLVPTSAWTLTAAEKAQQLSTLESVVRGWEDAKSKWENDLAARTAQLEQLNKNSDIVSREKLIKERAVDILKQAPSGIAQALTGKTEKAALTAVKMARAHIDQLRAQQEIIDIISETDQTQAEIAALKKSISDLEYNVQVAAKTISLTSLQIEKVRAATTTLQVPKWIDDALAEAVRAGERVEKRKQAERAERERVERDRQRREAEQARQRHERREEQRRERAEREERRQREREERRQREREERQQRLP